MHICDLYSHIKVGLQNVYKNWCLLLPNHCLHHGLEVFLKSLTAHRWVPDWTSPSKVDSVYSSFGWKPHTVPKCIHSPNQSGVTWTWLAQTHINNWHDVYSRSRYRRELQTLRRRIKISLIKCYMSKRTFILDSTQLCYIWTFTLTWTTWKLDIMEGLSKRTQTWA